MHMMRSSLFLSITMLLYHLEKFHEKKSFKLLTHGTRISTPELKAMKSIKQIDLTKMINVEICYFCPRTNSYKYDPVHR